MIPTVTKKGTSFKGAAAYYLHDKKALTNERVEFTQTQNLATDNPEMAWKMMAYTAMHQSEIKQASGGVAKGRKLTQPVYAYSLAWHPTQEPTRDHMIEVGLFTLKVLGLHEHEAILVAHNDADHKHVHLMVNRVHPETGIAAKLSNDRLKLSKWAEKYERDHGQIFCDQRVENNERRKSEFVKYREGLNKAEYHRWQREKIRQVHEQRRKDTKVLEELQKEKRDELLNNKENLIKEEIARIKELNRPSWSSIYRQQEQEGLKLQESQRSALSRLAYYIKNHNQEREQGTLDTKRGLLSGAYNAIANGQELVNALNKKHEKERKAFAERIAEQSRSALEQVNEDYVRQLEILKANQIKEQNLMKSRHSEESQKRAMDIASGKSKEEFDSQKRRKEFHEMQASQNDNKPLDLKEDFNKKNEFNIFRNMEEERNQGNSGNQEKGSGRKGQNIKKDFNVFRDMEKEGNNMDKNRNQEKDPGIEKEFNAFRKLEKAEKELDSTINNVEEELNNSTKADKEIDSADDLKKEQAIKKQFNAFRNLSKEKDRIQSIKRDTGMERDI